MNVGIVTLFDLYNVGNRLQNYAVTSVLQKLGFQCETLVPQLPPRTPYRQKVEQETKILLDDDPEQAQAQYPKTCKWLRFKSFTDTYIPWKEVACSQFSNLASAYDFIVVGSDQVWNPVFRSSIGQIENHLLAFAPPEKRVCFSPSIGLDDIPAHLYNIYEKEWCKYRFLSVREQTGAELIKKITGRDAIVVIDPTLMIDKEEWVSIAKPLPGFDYAQDYILFYFLGNPEEEISADMRGFLEHERKSKNLQLINLFDPNVPFLQSPGPAEILVLFSHASMVCTDSFHGTVFSILLGKPFLLANRILIMRNEKLNMSARTNTLLKKLGLEDHLPGKPIAKSKKQWEDDFARAYGRLEKERELALKFLKVSFCKEKNYENLYIK